jgi:SAM-dependent methyltransferase
MAAARTLPERMQRRLLPAYRRFSAWPPVGSIRFGSLRRLTPISSAYGCDRGQPIDRYYIEHFLRRHSGPGQDAPSVIRGHVLEIGQPEYVKRFGEPEAVDRIEVLDKDSTNPDATLIADLSDASEVPSDAFDCVICTQTLLLIYDLRAAVNTLHRVLRPGGALLVTVPGISQICRPEADIWGDYWRFTALSLRCVLEEAFQPGDITVETYGNVLTSAAFLYGLTSKDLKPRELESRDPNYQLVVAAKAIKATPDPNRGDGSPAAD